MRTDEQKAQDRETLEEAFDEIWDTGGNPVCKWCSGKHETDAHKWHQHDPPEARMAYQHGWATQRQCGEPRTLADFKTEAERKAFAAGKRDAEVWA